MKKILSILAIMIAMVMIPINVSSQTKSKSLPRTYKKKVTKPSAGKIELTLYCDTWENVIRGVENARREASPISRILLRENHYIDFVRNDGSLWKRFYLPYKSTDIYGEISFCNKAQTIVVSTSFRNVPKVILVTDEDRCVFFLDMEKTNADAGVFN